MPNSDIYTKCIPYIVGICLSAIFPTTVHSMSASQDNVVLCEPGYSSMRLYESSTSRLIQQDIRLSGVGSFDVKATAQGFTFEGISYARRSHFEKWAPATRVGKGRSSWTQSWLIDSDEYEQHVRIQLLKDTNDCKACTAKLEILSSCGS